MYSFKLNNQHPSKLWTWPVHVQNFIIFAISTNFIKQLVVEQDPRTSSTNETLSTQLSAISFKASGCRPVLNSNATLWDASTSPNV